METPVADWSAPTPLTVNALPAGAEPPSSSSPKVMVSEAPFTVAENTAGRTPSTLCTLSSGRASCSADSATPSNVATVAPLMRSAFAPTDTPSASASPSATVYRNSSS